MYVYSHRKGVEVFFGLKHRGILLVLTTAVLSVVLVYATTFAQRPVELHSVPVSSENSTVQIPELAQEKSKVFTEAELNKVIIEWGRVYGNDASLVLSDVNGNVLGAYNEEQQFFAASIYKLYVAYIGYQLVDSGELHLADTQWGDWNLETCLDEMIRTSHSPCAETLMSKIGRENIQFKLESYGLKNTAMHTIGSSAGDANKILAAIWQGTDLSEDSRAKLLTSMEAQKYRNAIPNGFAGMKTYNKVGFRDYDEYHDVATIELSDGRIVHLSIFTNKVSVPSIYSVAQKLNNQLQ